MWPILLAYFFLMHALATTVKDVGRRQRVICAILAALLFFSLVVFGVLWVLAIPLVLLSLFFLAVLGSFSFICHLLSMPAQNNPLLSMLAYTLLVAVGLWQRLWDSLTRVFVPVLNVYDTIDAQDVTIRSIVKQLIKGVLASCQLVVDMWRAVWELSTKPIRGWLDHMERLVHQVEQDYQQKIAAARQSPERE